MNAASPPADTAALPIDGTPGLHKACLFVVLFAFWMVLSGRDETKFVIYGLLTAAVTVWITYPLLLVPNQSRSKLYFVFGMSPAKFISYFGWLTYQLVLANIDVFLATTNQEMAIDPKVLKFKSVYDNPMASVVLANSITLTPGTVTMDVTDNGIFTIHALTTGAADGILGGDFPAHVAALFGEEHNFAVVDDGSDPDSYNPVQAANPVLKGGKAKK